MKKWNKGMVAAATALLALSLNSACRSVKSYQKNRLNDGEMALTGRDAEKFEKNAQVYREGGSGANGGKSGGGCGCNYKVIK